MSRPWAALGLVLALCMIMPREASGQSSKAANAPKMSQNYPNPFNPETWQPFVVGGFPTCPDPSRLYRVSMRVLNMIGQVIAVPVMRGSSGGVSGGTPLKNVSLPCGSYEAFWNGKVISNGREAASGIYWFVLEQDGVSTVSRAIVSK